ncbi:MAG: endo-1,4-beta-xylanase [Caulobacteraceae bacterium]|nr:endo-1,4-beta-xylanase [Caulobacteraceae bacterium]
MNRRRLLAAPLVLAACSRATADPVATELPPLKSITSFPLGVAASGDQFTDPAWARLVRANFDRITPEWEMKAEAFAPAGGGFDFSAPDRLVGAALAARLSVFGHTIVWQEQVPPALQAIDGDRRTFAAGFANYVRGVAGHYVGSLDGWDVVNEAVADDGSGLKTRNAFMANLGPDYIRLAFEHAREADARTPLLLNDYNLEQLPEKRRQFLRLAENLLRAGAPLTALGTQTHVPADLPRGAIAACLRDLASLGLPVHVSELDVSLARARGPERPAAIVGETVDALMALPERQRFGLTIWGARDRDSWLVRGGRRDAPVLFDDAGRPKSMAAALVEALR